MRSNQLVVREKLIGEIIDAGQYTPEIEHAPIQQLKDIVHTIRVEHHHYNHQVPAPRQPEMIPHRPKWDIERHEVVTVQQTSKFWKGMQLAGALMMIVATILIVSNAQAMQSTNGNGGEGWFVLGFLMAPAGFFMYVISRIGAWWHHG